MVILVGQIEIGEANDGVSPWYIRILKTLDETNVIKEEGLLGEKDCAVIGRSECEEVV